MSDHIHDPAEPFWRGLEAGEFRVPHCHRCNHAFFPPAPLCPDCGDRRFDWTTQSDGVVYSFTRQHRTAPGFDAPITIGLVELDVGPRILTPFDESYGALSIGQSVTIVPTEYTSEYDRGRHANRPFFTAVLSDDE